MVKKGKWLEMYFLNLGCEGLLLKAAGSKEHHGIVKQKIVFLISDLMFAAQPLHHLSHTASCFCIGCFLDSVSLILGLPKLQSSYLWLPT
jgi:hypothetical protein